MRLTEWDDDEKTKAHLIAAVNMYDVYTRLAEYEDIGTVVECTEYKADSRSFLRLAEKIWDHLKKSEDDGK